MLECTSSYVATFQTHLLNHGGDRNIHLLRELHGRVEERSLEDARLTLRPLPEQPLAHHSEILLGVEVNAANMEVIASPTSA